jgi:hypothetical protein
VAKLLALALLTPEARMPTLTIEYRTEAERLLLEQALAFFAQIRHVGATAPDGTVLAACERVALDSGRKLVRDTLASAVQSRADATDASPKSRAHGSRGSAPAGS